MSFGGFSSFAETSFSGQQDLNKAFLTGNSVTSSIGNVITNIDAAVTVTGNAVTAAVGDVVATDFAFVDVTTNLVTTAVGTVTVIGKANVTATTNVVTSSIGDAVTKANATVILTTAGSVTASMSFDGTTIIGKAVVVPDGSQLTASSTVSGVITWNEIDPNASQTWTNIET
jgi:hypothetical protein